MSAIVGIIGFMRSRRAGFKGTLSIVGTALSLIFLVVATTCLLVLAGRHHIFSNIINDKGISRNVSTATAPLDCTTVDNVVNAASVQQAEGLVTDVKSDPNNISKVDSFTCSVITYPAYHDFYAFQVAAVHLFNRGDTTDKDKGIFWFYAAQLRIRYQIKYDNEYGSDLGDMLYKGSALSDYALQDKTKLVKTIQDVLSWDERFPDQYKPDGVSDTDWQANKQDIRASLIANEAKLSS